MLSIYSTKSKCLSNRRIAVNVIIIRFFKGLIAWSFFNPGAELNLNQMRDHMAKVSAQG